MVIRGDKIEGTKHSSRRGDLMAGSVDGQRGLLRYASLVQRCLWKGRRVATVAYSSSSPLSRSHNRVVSVKPCLVTADRLAARNRSLCSAVSVVAYRKGKRGGKRGAGYIEQEPCYFCQPGQHHLSRWFFPLWMIQYASLANEGADHDAHLTTAEPRRPLAKRLCSKGKAMGTRDGIW